MQTKWKSSAFRGGKSLLTLSPIGFSLLVGVLLVSLYNRRFWLTTAEAVWYEPLESMLFLASLFICLTLLHAALLLLLPGRGLLKSVALLLFVLGAFGAYFADTYGVGINDDMLRNVIETDVAEITDLLSGKLLVYIVALGALPAALLTRCDLMLRPVRSEWKHRASFVIAAVFVSGVLLLLNAASLASFLRNHKPARYLLTPGNIMQAGISHWTRNRKNTSRALIDLGGPTTRATVARGKPLLMFLVIGETARSANFQLGGYDRPTNPQLMHEEVVYFSHVDACGTSTATSLPCMFSHYPREQFDARAAQRHTNLLDYVGKADLFIEWRDNNSGCKGVCARVRTLEYSSSTHPPQCAKGYCYDEVMLVDLEKTLRAQSRDSLIVFHQIGSHGPAYSSRYPRPFEIFKPACQSNQLQRCSREQVRNAYDNTIRYTDYNLDQQIHLLKRLEAEYDSVLIYVSDHGESLGENGLYLHAAPYVIAPTEQIRVPLLLWLSPSYQQRFGFDRECLRQQSTGRFSHLNLFHTVLGALALRNSLYEARLDLLSLCGKQLNQSTTALASAGRLI